MVGAASYTILRPYVSWCSYPYSTTYARAYIQLKDFVSDTLHSNGEHQNHQGCIVGHDCFVDEVADIQATG